MIRLGQHRRIPRERLIGEGAIAWAKDAASGIVLILFMIAAWTACEHAPAAFAWAHQFRLGLVAAGTTIFLN